MNQMLTMMPTNVTLSNMSAALNLSLDPDNFNNLPLCECDLQLGGPAPVTLYGYINIIVIWFFLPCIACVGICTNIMSVIIYSHNSLFHRSSSRYLIGLSCSDCCVCVSGILVITGDSVRSRSALLNDAFVSALPYTMPFMLTIQMVSVYITVNAAVDCFIDVWFSKTRWGHSFLRPSMASKILIGTILLAFLYNVPVFFELRCVSCWDELKLVEQLEVCPTAILQNDMYFTYYKVYAYTLLMAIIPFSLLLVLNALIVGHVIWTSKVKSQRTDGTIVIAGKHNSCIHNDTTIYINNGNHVNGNVKKDSDEDEEGSSTTMLVMVVALFLFCNSVSLAVVILEITLPEEVFLKFNHYLIDCGNLLVVINSSANFFIYLAFSDEYRVLFRSLIVGKSREKLQRHMSFHNNHRQGTLHIRTQGHATTMSQNEDALHADYTSPLLTHHQHNSSHNSPLLTHHHHKSNNNNVRYNNGHVQQLYTSREHSLDHPSSIDRLALIATGRPGGIKVAAVPASTTKTSIPNEAIILRHLKHDLVRVHQKRAPIAAYDVDYEDLDDRSLNEDIHIAHI